MIVRVDGTGPYVVAEVHNLGPPIPVDVLPHLYEPFSGGRPGGLGLGLYIARALVTALGGTLTARSDSSGTMFRVELPRHR